MERELKLWALLDISAAVAAQVAISHEATNDSTF